MSNSYILEPAVNMAELFPLYKVYIKVDNFGYIVGIDSSAFLKDTTDWIEIDRGYDIKHHHAQGNYFEKSIITLDGAYQYKFIDGKIEECSPEEIVSQENAIRMAYNAKLSINVNSNPVTWEELEEVYQNGVNSI